MGNIPPRTIPVSLTDEGRDRLNSYYDRYGEYSWSKNLPYIFGILDSVDKSGFLPETLHKDISRLESFGLIVRISPIEVL